MFSQGDEDALCRKRRSDPYMESSPPALLRLFPKNDDPNVVGAGDATGGGIAAGEYRVCHSHNRASSPAVIKLEHRGVKGHHARTTPR
mmetsp:Transcript_34630/g.72069  ORF Transcript_34630/g.72069 Transcript_34630/m.72069 type:complete len:88 (+) Transcript_34630:225-488(+)